MTRRRSEGASAGDEDAVDYRCNAERRLRVKTIEIVVEEVEWQPTEVASFP
ncbi:MAG TPA: hypothetical protein VF057_03125 [Thermoanaerobaculia bacterium]